MLCLDALRCVVDDLEKTISHPLGFGVTKLVSNVTSQRSDVAGRAIAQNAQDDALRLWMYRISVSEDRNAKRIAQVSQDFHPLWNAKFSAMTTLELVEEIDSNLDCESSATSCRSGWV